MNYPLVSVIIPTYNRAHCITRSIMSVLYQAYDNIELIIIDDGSVDDTEEVVKRIKDKRIRYYKKENGGSSSARNMGIELAKGSWIAFQDSDDLWYPDKLEKQMNVVLSTIYEIYFCKLLMKKKNRIIEFPKRIKPGKVWKDTDLYGVGTQTIILKSYIAKKELFDTSIPRYEDTEWLYRIIQNHQAHFLDMPLVEYEINEDSLSSDYEKMYYGLLAISEKYPTFKHDTPKMALHAAKDIATGFLHYLFKAEFRKAFNFFKLFWRFYPGIIGMIRYCLRKMSITHD